MTTKSMKELTVAILALVAFLLGICINPTDDSPTWLEDFLAVKTTAAIALVSAALVVKYWNAAPEKSNR